MGLRSRPRNTSASATQNQPRTENPHSIFAIHEIIEKILLEVPAIDLLTKCRGVCRTWKVLIEISSLDLKYYSLSGLRRPHPAADKASDEQILTPLAVEVLARFWKRLAAETVGNIRSSEDRSVRHLFRRLYRTVHCGKRSSDSSCERPAGGYYPCRLLIIGPIYICLYPLAIVAYHFYDKILRPFGPTAREQRATKRIGIQLIKKFQQIWQKIHIFHPESSEGAVLIVRASANWRSREDYPWRFGFCMDKYFGSLPNAVIVLMTPLIDAVYSMRPGPFPEHGYSGSAVTIDLKHQSDTDHVNRSQKSPFEREVITFGGHRPFDVYREHKRPLDTGYTQMYDNVLKL